MLSRKVTIVKTDQEADALKHIDTIVIHSNSAKWVNSFLQEAKKSDVIIVSQILTNQDLK
jgi:hypothetical protein